MAFQQLADWQSRSSSDGSGCGMRRRQKGRLDLTPHETVKGMSHHDCEVLVLNDQGPDFARGTHLHEDDIDVAPTVRD